MSKEIAKKGTQIEIAELVSLGKITDPEDIVRRYKVGYSQAVGLLSNPSFIALVSAFSKARTQLAWHAKALPRIVEMIDDPNPDIALRAMKLLGQITDSVKGADMNININLESMVKQFTDPNKKAANDLHDTAIDAEYQRILSEKD
jgi:hypothetical protein